MASVAGPGRRVSAEGISGGSWSQGVCRRQISNSEVRVKSAGYLTEVSVDLLCVWFVSSFCCNFEVILTVCDKIE
jgi:hypothetical protein